MKKHLLISLNRRIILDDSNARAIDIKNYIGYNKLFNNTEVTIASKKTKKEKDLDFYLDFNEVDFNNYEEITIFNFNCNFFGGYIDDETIVNLKKLAAFKGKVTYLLTDPKLYVPDFVNQIQERLDKKGENPISKEEWLALDKVYRSISIIFCGRNYPFFLEKLNPGYCHPFEREIKLFEHVAMNSVVKMDNSPIPHEEKIYDICYYGNNRGGYRNKRLKHFVKNPKLCKNIIGFEIPLENAHFNPIMKYYEFGKQVKKSFSSLIIGDEEHNDIFTTYRFFEALHLGIVAFIDVEFDSKKTLINDEFLKEFLYVKDSQDIIDRVNKLRADPSLYTIVINAQTEEFNKYRNV